MKFDTKDIKARAKEDFEKAWLETARILPEKSDKDYLGGKGKEHILHSLISEIRGILLNLGFDEVENSVFVPEEEVYLQYGPEAPVILDRCYYLAGLPRPDIGLGKEKIDAVHKINPKIKVEILKDIFRQYREGAIEGDNLFEEMVNALSLKPEEAARIIALFPEFRSLTPVGEKTTLRSHMTASWFPTLKALAEKAGTPLKLFSIGMRFRREQKLDATHLRAHYGASVVVMDPEASLDAGKEISRQVFERLKFKDINFVLKKATSNYYAPGTEYEIYSGNIEVGDCGMYSPVALSNYGIEYPVFNIGFGLERILMIRSGIGDVREVLYPQFYKDLALSDQDIASNISITKKPSTPEGKKIAESISKIGRMHGDESSPCGFQVYSGKLLGKDIEVSIVEKESETKLLGPAALNGIYVYKGSVYGLPPGSGGIKNDLLEAKTKGIRLDFGFLDSVANLFAQEIEARVSRGEKTGFLQVKMAKTASDVNVSVSDVARRFIMSGNKVISLKGPVFTAVEFLLK